MGVCRDVGYFKQTNKQKKCSSSFFFLLQREKQFTAHCNGGASSHRVSASRHTNTSLLFIIDLIVLLKTTRGSSKSKDMPESRKSKIAADSIYMSPISPMRIKSPQTFLMSKNFNEPRDILYFPCLEKSKRNSSTNLFLWGWETYISADIIQQKKFTLAKSELKDNISRESRHACHSWMAQSWLKAANYAARQVMILWRETDGGGES